MEIIFLIIGLVIGAIAAWFISSFKFKGETSKVEERSRILEQGKSELETKLNVEQQKVLDLNSKLSSLQSNYTNLQTKITELKENEQQLLEKFENLANRIFKEKTDEFSKQSKTNLQEILNPLKERIVEFQSKVEETNEKSIQRHSSLKEQLLMLKEMNQQVTQEAKNLTTALKGQSKTQGNWGEFILESILEKSGLVKGREYVVQESLTAESGRRFQPDVIINLPENKSIVIDSKVSLVAYERFFSTEEKEEKERALKEHITSIRAHVKNLNSKGYQDLYQLHTLDFVIMFIPIESALALAVQNDPNLSTEAFEQRILILSPSILLAALKIFSSIWQQEKQNQNALDIAKQSGALYDKFVGFIEDLKLVGERMDQAKTSYVNAMSKLVDGSGNLVGRVEKIKKLGAKASKSLPPNILNRADIDDENNLLEN